MGGPSLKASDWLNECCCGSGRCLLLRCWESFCVALLSGRAEGEREKRAREALFILHKTTMQLRCFLAPPCRIGERGTVRREVKATK